MASIQDSMFQGTQKMGSEKTVPFFVTIETSSILLTLDDEIWTMIVEYIGPVYKTSMKRTSKFFAAQSNKIPVVGPKLRYLEYEPNPTTKYIKWAKNNGCPWSEWTCRDAARNGDLNMLKWLRDNGCPWNKWTCTAAAEHGDLNMLKWLHENGCPWGEMTCYYAARFGHLKVLQYLRINKCPQHEFMYSTAKNNGHEDIVNWLHSIGYLA